MMAGGVTLRRAATTAALAAGLITAGLINDLTAAPAVAEKPVVVAESAHSAVALNSAQRIAGPIVPPTAAIPARLRFETEQNALTFNSCTANLVRNDSRDVIGLAGAAHCIQSGSNVMKDGRTFGTGNTTIINRAAILLDARTDVFYVGLHGHSASAVNAQLVHNHERVGISPHHANDVTFMTGYPSYHNISNRPVTLALAEGGLVRWPHDTVDTIATFGNWNSDGQSCSPRASGSGLYHDLEGHGYVLVGILASRAEFEQVQTMPYNSAYGLELRTYFERQLGRTIDAEFFCGFAPPTPS